MASKKAVIETIAAIKTIYNYFGKDTEPELLVNTWSLLLSSYTDDEIERGLFLALRVCKYAPVPADIIEQIENFRQIEKPSSIELWALYRKALKQTNYYSYRLHYNYIDATGISQGEKARIAIEDIWQSLPQELKIYLGGKDELIRNARELNEGDFTFEKNRFEKQLPILTKRVQDKANYLALSQSLLQLNNK